MMLERPLVRIVLATDSEAPSGVGEHMLTLARALPRSMDVTVAFSSRGEGARFLERATKANLATKALPDGASAFSDWLRQSEVSLLHVHAGIGWEGHSLSFFGAAAGVPVVRTEHLPYVLTDAHQQAEHGAAFAKLARTVFVSEAVADSYRRAGYPESATVTIRNGTVRPTVGCRREETRAALGLSDEAPLVATVARFTAQKGYGCLLDAACRVLARNGEVRFLLVGTGPDHAAIEARSRRLGIAPSLFFLGVRSDVPDLLAASDLFVLPSLFEGLPLVVLEAMALGIPIVATRIGGTAEALGSDYPWLVDAGDPTALSTAIIAALADRQQCRLWADANRRRFEKLFDAARMGAETAALYRAVLTQKARPT